MLLLAYRVSGGLTIISPTRTKPGEHSTAGRRAADIINLTRYERFAGRGCFWKPLPAFAWSRCEFRAGLASGPLPAERVGSGTSTSTSSGKVRNGFDIRPCRPPPYRSAGGAGRPCSSDTRAVFALIPRDRRSRFVERFSAVVLVIVEVVRCLLGNAHHAERIGVGGPERRSIAISGDVLAGALVFPSVEFPRLWPE